MTFVGFFTTRIVLDTLGKSDFGLFNVVGGIIVILNLLNTAMISSTYRFIAFEMGKKEDQDVNKIFNISFTLHCILALIIIVFGELIGLYYVENYLKVDPLKLPDARFIFHIAILSAVCSTISVPFHGLITAVEKFSVSAIIDIIRSLLNLIAVLFLMYYAGNKLRLYGVISFALVAFSLCCYAGYCYKFYYPIARWKYVKYCGKHKEMFFYSNWILLGASAWIGKSQGAQLIINYFFSTTLNAAFSIANQVNHLIELFANNLNVAAIPQITKSFSGNDNERSEVLSAHIQKYTSFLFLLVGFPLMLEIDFLLSLWLKEVPEFTAIFCRLMIFNAFLTTLTTAGINSYIQATGRIKYFQICSSIISLSALPISFFLYKFGYPVYSILITYTCTQTINICNFFVLVHFIVPEFHIRRFIKISYIKILKVVIALLLFAAAYIYIGVEDWKKFAGLFFCECYILLAIYLFGLSESERAFVMSKLMTLKYGRYKN